MKQGDIWSYVVEDSLNAEENRKFDIKIKALSYRDRLNIKAGFYRYKVYPVRI